MKTVVTRNTMKKSDEYMIQNKISSIELMNKASCAILKNFNFQGNVLIVSGIGNNAGDGYALACHLNRKGIHVELLLIEEKFTKDSQYYFNECKKFNISYHIYHNTFDFSKYDVLVDAIYGYGFHGMLTDKIKQLIIQMNESGKTIVSIDINSGLNADNGLADVCVRSDLTVAIGSYKPGHFLNMAKDYIKKIVCEDVDIEIKGNPYYLLEEEDFRGMFKERLEFSHKGTYGNVAIIGGSMNYSGSVKLANLSLSALRTGSGLCKLVIPNCIVDGVMPYILESTLFPMPDQDGLMLFSKEKIDEALQNTKAILLGIGIGKSDEISKVISYVIKNYTVPIIIDADGLNALAHINEKKEGLILTPHLKEFSRLSGYSINEILNDPIELAKTYASQNKAYVLLKGPTTIVTDGEDVYLINRGCSGMATVGSGDVLSGILLGLCSYQKVSLKLIALGAYINGVSGERASSGNNISMTSRDTVYEIKNVVKGLL